MREYLLTIMVAAATTYVLIGPVGALAHRLGAAPEARDRDVHRFPTPRLGGLAMMGGLLAAMVVASSLPQLSVVFEVTADARAVLTGALVIGLLGFADDVLDLGAVTKLAGQVVAAGLMVVQGLQLYWLPLPSGPLVLSPALAGLLTVFTVLVAVNAVNFVDGLDGLAAGVVGIGAAAFFSYSYILAVEEGLSRMTMPALISASLIGMCLGFLPANINRARIFMGDSGSMLCGLLLAAGSISLTGQFDSQAVPGSSFLPAILPLLLPVAVIAIPFVDLVAAIWRRARAGRSVFAPDKQHLHHRLLERGHSHRRTVAILWVWAGLVAFGLVLVSLAPGPIIVALVALAVVAGLALTFAVPRVVSPQ